MPTSKHRRKGVTRPRTRRPAPQTDVTLAAALLDARLALEDMGRALRRVGSAVAAGVRDGVAEGRERR